MTPTLLIIDDDARLNQLLKDFLKDFGFDVVTTTHPAKGLKTLKQASPDLVILDIMLPEMDGFEVCKAIRQTSNVPIIMLTARGEVTDKVVGRIKWLGWNSGLMIIWQSPLNPGSWSHGFNLFCAAHSN
jgi:DNA-binding response OmpR family regulator